MSFFENLICRSNKDLIELCLYFGIKAHQSAFKMARDIESHLMNPKHFKRIAADLTEEEHDMLKFFAENQINDCKISDSTGTEYPNLEYFGYLPLNENGEEIQIPLDLINLYIEVVMDQSVPFLEESSYDDVIMSVQDQYEPMLLEQDYSNM